MLREIVLLGDDVLRRKAKPLKEVDGQTRRLIDDMVETMHDADGIGLAANQVGIAKRVIVVRDGDQTIALVNPQIRRKRGKETGVEGCLSMPGLQGNVPRAREITVTGLDRGGRQVTLDAEGLLARVFQHEIDHLNGTLFIDHTRDLWWLERVDEHGNPVDEEEDEEEAADVEDAQVHVRRVPTTLAEVHDYYEDLRAEDGDAARLAEEVAELDEAVEGEVREM